MPVFRTPVFTWAKMWGFVVIFRRKKASASRTVWETQRNIQPDIDWHDPHCIEEYSICLNIYCHDSESRPQLYVYSSNHRLIHIATYLHDKNYATALKPSLQFCMEPHTRTQQDTSIINITTLPIISLYIATKQYQRVSEFLLQMYHTNIHGKTHL